MKQEEIENCAKCTKPLHLCVCRAIKPLKSKLQVLILQHPQEPDRELGSAIIAHQVLSNSLLKIGLSWRSLEHCIGTKSDPKQWAVLFLGSVKPTREDPPIFLVDKKGEQLADNKAVLATLKGIVLLDGNWSQSKTLWWRNAWLLKLRRMVLNPKSQSLFGKIRREPRRESISTLESIALVLDQLEPKAESSPALISPFKLLLDLYRNHGISDDSTEITASDVR